MKKTMALDDLFQFQKINFIHRLFHKKLARGLHVNYAATYHASSVSSMEFLNKD